MTRAVCCAWTHPDEGQSWSCWLWDQFWQMLQGRRKEGKGIIHILMMWVKVTGVKGEPPSQVGRTLSPGGHSCKTKNSGQTLRSLMWRFGLTKSMLRLLCNLRFTEWQLYIFASYYNQNQLILQNINPNPLSFFSAFCSVSSGIFFFFLQITLLTHIWFLNVTASNVYIKKWTASKYGPLLSHDFAKIRKTKSLTVRLQGRLRSVLTTQRRDSGTQVFAVEPILACTTGSPARRRASGMLRRAPSWLVSSAFSASSLWHGREPQSTRGRNPHPGWAPRSSRLFDFFSEAAHPFHCSRADWVSKALDKGPVC